MKKLSLLTILSLLLTSCSFFNLQRHPAEEIIQTQDEILQVFEFHSSGIIDQKKDYRTSIQEYVRKDSRGTHGAVNEMTVEFLEDITLPKGIAYFPEFQVKDNFYKIIILHSKEAVSDAIASAELFNFLFNLKDEKYFKSYFAAFEMYYNAIEQDPIAAHNWAKIREASANMDNYIKLNILDFSTIEVKDALKTRGAEWAKEKDDYLEMAKNKLKLQKKQDLERRTVIDILDKASVDHQFKNLVAKNDRAGASDLLKKYLPWEQMAPFEKRYWETYLDAIVHPLPMEQRIFIYRGINDDFIYSAYQGEKELEKETAKKEGKIFVMSTIMTKNQGTWNRRLRSLTAMNEKFIGTNSKLESEFTKSARIVTMFTNHSINPQGSPFLSLTPKFNIAQIFGAQKMSAYALDPRLLSFNFASHFQYEAEFLLPLMVFPEDVVGYFDNKIHTDKKNTEELMKNLFREKLVKAHGEQKGEEIFQKVLKNSQEYFDSALNRLGGKMLNGHPQESSLASKFFNKIFVKKIIAPIVEIAPKTNTTCVDIIASFWKQ